MKKFLVPIKSFIKKHTILSMVVCFVVGGLIIGAITGAVIASNKTKTSSNSPTASDTSSGSSIKVTEGNPENASVTNDTSPSSSPNASSNGSTNKTNSQPSSNQPTAPTPSTPAPTAKQPTTQYFISGTVTPVLSLNQPPNGYSVWSNYSSAFNATGYNKVKISWFIDNTADPSIEIQISYDGSSWTSYKSAINSGHKTGSLSFDLPAPYMRIIMNNGSCVPSYCESPRPSWAQPYTSTVSGYFTL